MCEHLEIRLLDGVMSVLVRKLELRYPKPLNGEPHTLETEARTLLVHLLRDTLRVTSPHVGCDTSQCGACTVHLDGHAVKSCTVLGVQADGKNIDTVDGLARDGQLHPLQLSFQDKHALQCGFCTPGMVMSSLELLRHNPNPNEEETRAWLKGNFCRCTGYQHILEAIASGAEAMRVAGLLEPESVQSEPFKARPALKGSHD